MVTVRNEVPAAFWLQPFGAGPFFRIAALLVAPMGRPLAAPIKLHCGKTTSAAASKEMAADPRDGRDSAASTAQRQKFRRDDPTKASRINGLESAAQSSGNGRKSVALSR